MQSSPRSTMRYVPFLVILAVAGAGMVFLRDYLDFDMLARYHGDLAAFRDSNMTLAVVVFITVYVLIVAFSLPGATITTLAGGFLFGLFPGVIWNVLAATIGAVLIFLAAKSGFGTQLSARMDAGAGRVARLKAGIEKNQWSVLFLMRLVPAVPFFVANVVPAFLNVPLHRFAITTALGIIPGAIVFTSIGAGLGELFANGAEPDLGIILEPQILLPLIGLCILALLPMFMKRMGREANA